MSDILEKNSGLNDFQIKLRHLVFNVSVLGNATPASKSHFVDISDSVFLKTEGKDDVTAKDPLSGLTITAENDVNGIFTILIESQNCKSIKRAQVFQGATNVLAESNVTALKNIALEIDGTNDHSSASTFIYRVELDYLID